MVQPNHDLTDSAILERWRGAMGRGVAEWAGAGMDHAVGATSWHLLSGVPSPDVNMALVWDAEPSVLAAELAVIEERAVPALLLLAGAAVAAADTLPESWSRAGTMPLMSADLSTVPLRPDLRVRKAGTADADAVAVLLMEAYGMERLVAEVCVGLLDRDPEAMTIWVLEEEGEVVSTVTTGRVDDILTVWSMGTPERLGRRGYGRALLGAVLEEAHRAGVRTGLLGATPAGLPLYEATGWRVVEEWQILVNAESVQFAD